LKELQATGQRYEKKLKNARKRANYLEVKGKAYINGLNT
jgi:hypothetical protein